MASVIVFIDILTFLKLGDNLQNEYYIITACTISFAPGTLKVYKTESWTYLNGRPSWLAHKTKYLRDDVSSSPMEFYEKFEKFYQN